MMYTKVVFQESHPRARGSSLLLYRWWKTSLFYDRKFHRHANRH